MKHILIFILSIGFIACGPNKNDANIADKSLIVIEWSDHLIGDFSFTDKWSYPEGVYKNEFGQLTCDGFCPEEVEAMKDSTGYIYKDSLNAFYKLIDTTHQAHSIQCDAWCYEWAGTDFMEARQISKDTVECYTLYNEGTHCSLHFYMVNNNCYPTIELNSITPNGNATYLCKGGYIKIDKGLWKTGIIKADFNMNFEHTENPQQAMFWKGKIYTKVKQK